ncbi:MAG: hypothetical protein GWP04_10555 [Gammaproteobacteria bacterium]|nr:hypothetical protein [Gammaproteobacteria bacterium]
MGGWKPSRQRIATPYLLYTITVLVFVGLVLIKPAFGPIDDCGFFTTVMRGVRIPFNIAPEIGRFFPLSGQEYNLVALFSTEPFWFYTVNAVELAIFSVVLLKLMGAATDKPALITGVAVLLFLSPAFTDSWFRLLVPERTSALLFGIFLVMYARAQRTRKAAPVALAVISGTLALYYKEPGFLALGTFATVHLAMTWKTSPRLLKLLDWLLLTGSAAFLLTYFIVVYSHRGEALYGADNIASVLILPRTVFTYTMTDPALILGLLPLAAYRASLILLRRTQPHPLFDPMLAAGTAYVLAYFVLRLRSPHYLRLRGEVGSRRLIMLC